MSGKGVHSNEVFVDSLSDEGGEANQEEWEGAGKGAEEQALGDQNVQPGIFQKLCQENGRKG